MEPDDPNTRTLFSTCREVILEADRQHQDYMTHPEDYVIRTMYCFGTGPPITDEELDKNLRRARRRNALEAETLASQTALFEKLVREVKCT